MPMYAVKLSEQLKENQARAGQLVGLYYAPNIRILAELVEEVTDTIWCDYARLPFGGVEWYGEAPVADALGEWAGEDENETKADINDGGEMSLSLKWFEAINDGLKWKEMKNIHVEYEEFYAESEEGQHV